jgi:Ca2+-transporting ATPase
LAALQILWINFVGDGPPALAIALDSSRAALLDPPRSPRAPLLGTTALQFIAADGLLKGGFGLGLLVLLPTLGASSVSAVVSSVCWHYAERAQIQILRASGFAK